VTATARPQPIWTTPVSAVIFAAFYVACVNGLKASPDDFVPQ
jgi:hypothetical protein